MLLPVWGGVGTGAVPLRELEVMPPSAAIYE